MRKFEFHHIPYERHETPPTVVFRKQGMTLLKAFKKLPNDVLVEVLGMFDDKGRRDPVGTIIADYAADHVDFNDQALINFLNNHEYGLTDAMVVYEYVNGGLVHVAGPDYKNEGEDQEW